MATHEPLRQPHKTDFTAVRFTYGETANPTVLAITDWTENTSIPGISGGFQSDPSLAVKLPQFNGVLKESPARVTISDQYDLALALIEGTPHSTVVVEIWKFSESTLSTGDSLLKHFSGIVTRADGRPDGKQDRVALYASNLKSRLSVALGLPANHHCILPFNGFGCRLGATPAAPVSRAVVSITRNVLVSTLFTLVPKHRYVRGYIEFEGLRIGIRDFEPSTSTFVLFQEPPSTWDTATVTFIEGCDKSLETCRDDKLNEDNFGGYGHAMLARHPMLETR